MEIRFNVIGCCTQTIELQDDCPYTEEQIIESLNGQGDLAICTTIQEGGELICFSGKGGKIGMVVASTVDAEYTEFEKTA